MATLCQKYLDVLGSALARSPLNGAPRRTVTVFLLDVDTYWLDSEFRMEQALQLLPLAKQLRIKNRKCFSDRCLSLGNVLLQVFVTWLVVAYFHSKEERDTRTSQRTSGPQIVRMASLEEMVLRFHYNKNGKPSFDGTGLLPGDVSFDFNLSNDKESLINSMVISVERGAQHDKSSRARSQRTQAIGIDLINTCLITEDFVTELAQEILHPFELALLSSHTHAPHNYARLATTVSSSQYGESRSDEHDKFRVFAQLWSLKESYSKYLGTGLVGLDLQSLEFRNVKLLKPQENGTQDTNDGVELYVHGQKVENLKIATKLYSDHVYYSIIYHQDKPENKIQLPRSAAQKGAGAASGGAEDGKKEGKEQKGDKIREVKIDLREMNDILLFIRDATLKT